MRGFGVQHGLTRSAVSGTAPGRGAGGMTGTLSSPPSASDRGGSGFNTRQRQVSDTSEKLNNWSPLNEDFHSNNYQAKHAKRGDDYSIYVKNIPPEIDENGLRTMFRTYVTAEDPLRVTIKTSTKGITTNFGFVHYSSLSVCEEAIRVMNNHSIGNNTLNVSLGRNEKNNQNRDGFGGLHTSRDKKHYDHRAGGFVQGERSDRGEAAGGARRETMFKPFTSPSATVTSPSASTAPAVAPVVCDVCSKEAELACARCSIPYCSPQCQRDAWTTHQTVCGSSNRSTPVSALAHPSATSTPRAELVTNGVSNGSGSAVTNGVSNSHAVDITLPKVTMPGTVCKVMYVDGVSPLQFHVQLVGNREVIETVMDSMESAYNETDGQGCMCKEGDIVAAKSAEDSSWYRAKVLSTARDNVKVQYLDYGNTEDLPSAALRPLTVCTDIMPQAMPCRLHGITPVCEWSAESNTAFGELVLEAGLDMSCQLMEEEEEVFSVELTMPSGDSVAQRLVTLGHATSIMKEKLPRLSGLEQNTAPVEVIITHMEQWNELYIAQYSDQDEINDLMVEISGYCAGIQPGGPVSVGDVVAAVYEGVKYRSVVQSVEGSKCSVWFADYGNKETLDTASVYALPAQFLALPAQAIQCQLQGLQCTAQPSAVKDFIKQKFPMDDVLTAQFLSYSKGCYTVDLQYNGLSAAEELLSNSLCKKASPTPVAQPAAQVRTSPVPAKASPVAAKASPVALSRASPVPARASPSLASAAAALQSRVPVMLDRSNASPLPLNTPLQAALSYINSPSDIAFNFMTADQAEYNNSISGLVQEAGQSSSSFQQLHATPLMNEAVLGLSAEYGEWFRGVVTDVKAGAEAGAVTVYSLDFGNTCSLSLAEVKPCNSDLAKLSPLAFQATFQGAEAILQRMEQRKEDGLKIVQEILVAPFKACVLSQKGSSVVITSMEFDIVDAIKSKIRPPPAVQAVASPVPTAVPTAVPTVVPTAVPTVPVGYSLVPTAEWERMLLDVDRLKRIVRLQGHDIP